MEHAEHGASHRRRRGAPRATAEAARAHIEAHCTEHVRIADLAAAAGVSVCHLVRQFTRYVGVPPHAYLIRRRLEHALRLLREGASPCTVAYLAGFADQAHFTRQFRRAFGAPPGEYQRDALHAPG